MTVAAEARPSGHHPVTFSEPSPVKYRAPAPKAVHFPLEETEVIPDTPPSPPSPEPVDAHVNTGSLPVKEHPPLIKEYGDQWDWNEDAQDYISVKDGVKLFYTDYQRPGGTPAFPALPPAASYACDLGIQGHSPTRPSTPDLGPRSIPRPLPPPTPEPPSYEEPLPDTFQFVTKPKRFFTPGRIFKTVWFEPAGSGPNNLPFPPPPPPPPPITRHRPSDLTQWSSHTPAFRGEKPLVRYRWFVVVRRRPHHSLCFSITTFGPSSSSTKKGRPTDYVVLHSSAVEPPRPYEGEGITKESVAVIIEDGGQFISPIARLDCGRVYTVEDGLRVMKIGRVHPDEWGKVDGYYRESVE